MSRLRNLWNKIRFLLSLDWEGFQRDQAKAIDRMAEAVALSLRKEFDRRASDIEETLRTFESSLLDEIRRSETDLRAHVDAQVSKARREIEKEIGGQFLRLGELFEETREEVADTMERRIATLRTQAREEVEQKTSSLYDRVRALLTDQSEKLRSQLDAFFGGQVEAFKKAVSKTAPGAPPALEDETPPLSYIGQWNSSMPIGLFSSASLSNHAERPYA